MPREAVLARLSRPGPIIAPSMLKCDFGHLRREIEALHAAGADVIHWDAMDGHFVPNLSYGAPVIASLREQTDAIFDAHLMIANPERYLTDYIKAGCDCITVHVEAVEDPAQTLRAIREADRVAGLAINPKTPVSAVSSLLEHCDLILVMSVEPGFGGQAFQPQALEKLQEIRSLAGGSAILSVDGGIGPDTIGPTAGAGANLFVVGSAIFDQDDYQRAISDLTRKAEATV